MVDCPKCGAKAGFTCNTRHGGVGAWSFHNERWLVAPIRHTLAIKHLRTMRDVKPKKETHPVRVHIEQPVAGWFSAKCKANHHKECTSLNCSCACGHR